MKKLIVIVALALLTTNVTVANDCSEEFETSGGSHICYDTAEKFNSRVMIEFIKSTGVGMVLQAALDRFQRDYYELNQMSRRQFEDLYNDQREKREREERERVEREGREGRDGRTWGGHLDPSVGPGIARGGMRA